MVGAYLTGAFGQSQDLYKARNEAKRGRGLPEAAVQQAKKDTQRIIQLQRDAGMDFVVDPMFNFFYLFQPFAEQVEGVKAGPQENWFNNNVFYWRPQIHGPLPLQTGFTEKYLHLHELPADGTAMLVLPSPYTMLMLSDSTGYPDRTEAVTNLAEVICTEAQHLASQGIGRIQYDEPAIVVKQSLGSLTEEDLMLLKRGMEVCGHVDGVTTSLHTYFGDAGPIIPYLISLPVDCLGIDGTETSLVDILKHDYAGKEIALGLLDARNTSLEDPQRIVEQIRAVADRTHPAKLWLTTNTGTEYRGFTHGTRKLDLLRRVRSMLHE
ncbi:hypothetical protein HYX14_00050 [Candidatus Woesearchaeota archaeon]|nr:hypothetical protein [Candidatus Woesearchaeota archaeon]